MAEMAREATCASVGLAPNQSVREGREDGLEHLRNWRVSLQRRGSFHLLAVHFLDPDPRCHENRYAASMTNPALLWNAPKPPTRTPRPGERVWSMTKDEKRVDAELRDHGEVGCEVQFFFNGELAYGRLWRTRDGALMEAESKRRELTAKGWPLINA
jgi:hypothetical protein